MKIIKNYYYLIRNKILKHFIGAYNIWDIYGGHFKVTYRGIPTLKCPFDYVMYQMIISELKPDLVIEIGTNFGGTSLYIADLMEAIGHGEVHTIDIEDRTEKTLKQHPRIKLFTNGWKNYDLENTSKFLKIIVIDDASHIYEDTLETIKTFSKIIPVGSYLIIEDGIVSRLKRAKLLNGGPLRAIEDFMKTNDCFVVDNKYCNMFGEDTTFNTKGYLKRIK